MSKKKELPRERGGTQKSENGHFYVPKQKGHFLNLVTQKSLKKKC